MRRNLFIPVPALTMRSALVLLATVFTACSEGGDRAPVDSQVPRGPLVDPQEQLFSCPALEGSGSSEFEVSLDLQPGTVAHAIFRLPGPGAWKFLVCGLPTNVGASVVATPTASARIEVSASDAAAILEPVPVSVYASRGSDFVRGRLLLSVRGAVGTLDRSFGSNGFVQVEPSVADILIEDSGRILLTGTSVSPGIPPSGTYGYELAITAFRPSGSIDDAFGTNGRTLASAGWGASGSIMARNSAGDILAVGEYRLETSCCDLVIAKVDGAGLLDPLFANGGKLTIVHPDVDYALGLSQLDSGDYLLAYQSGGVLALRVFRADGTPQESFGTSGEFRLDPDVFETWSRNVRLVKSSSGFVVGGLFTIFKLSSDGTPDPDFEFVDTTSLSTVGDLMMDQVDRIVGFGGYSSADETIHETRVWRLLPDGTLDPSFGEGGITALSAISNDWHRIHLLPDGEIIVAGVRSSGSIVVVRLLPNGLLDHSWGIDGVSSFPASRWAHVQGLAAMPDGRIILAVHALNGSNYEPDVLIRLW